MAHRPDREKGVTPPERTPHNRGELDASEVYDECMERLDLMVNQLVTIAQRQGALVLGAKDLIKMRNTFNAQVNDFMMPYLAASAVLRLVNIQLLEAQQADRPNT